MVRWRIQRGLSVARACRLVQLQRATYRYAAHPRDATALRTTVQTLAMTYPRYGYRRIRALVRRTQAVNEQQIRRIWREEQVQVRRIGRKRRVTARPPRLVAERPGQLWAYDVVEDALGDGRKLKILTVMDAFTREGLAVDVGRTTSAERVLGVLRTRIAEHGAPEYLRSDNGAAFVADAVQLWLYETGVQTVSIDPGKPWQHGKEERFNGTVRDACLNRYTFSSVAEARVHLAHVRHSDTTDRPQSSLG
jgi:putative transposase